VKEFHQIEGSIQVKEFLQGATEFLGQMIRVANVKEQFLVTMALVADFSYAWKIVENFMPLIHKLIQRVQTRERKREREREKGR
jgi:WASH complex subunit strumpellin